MEMLYEWRFSTRTLPLRSKTHPARCAQGERALVVVLRHLLELLVLHDLQNPEAHGQHREQPQHDILQDVQADADAASILNQ